MLEVTYVGGDICWSNMLEVTCVGGDMLEVTCWR